MTIEFPSTVNNRIIRGSYSWQAKDDLARSNYDQGPTDSRRRFTKLMAEVSLGLRLTSSELGYLEEFYELTLGHGSKWFVMRLYKGGYVGYVVKFSEPPKPSDTPGQINGQMNFSVSFSLEVRDFFIRRGDGELWLIGFYGDEWVFEFFADIHHTLTVDYPAALGF